MIFSKKKKENILIELVLSLWVVVTAQAQEETGMYSPFDKGEWLNETEWKDTIMKICNNNINKNKLHNKNWYLSLFAFILHPMLIQPSIHRSIHLFNVCEIRIWVFPLRATTTTYPFGLSTQFFVGFLIPLLFSDWMSLVIRLL